MKITWKKLKKCYFSISCGSHLEGISSSSFTTKVSTITYFPYVEFAGFSLLIKNLDIVIYNFYKVGGLPMGKSLSYF